MTIKTNDIHVNTQRERGLQAEAVRSRERASAQQQRAREMGAGQPVTRHQRTCTHSTATLSRYRTRTVLYVTSKRTVVQYTRTHAKHTRKGVSDLFAAGRWMCSCIVVYACACRHTRHGVVRSAVNLPASFQTSPHHGLASLAHSIAFHSPLALARACVSVFASLSTLLPSPLNRPRPLLCRSCACAYVRASCTCVRMGEDGEAWAKTSRDCARGAICAHMHGTESLIPLPPPRPPPPRPLLFIAFCKPSLSSKSGRDLPPAKHTIAPHPPFPSFFFCRSTCSEAYSSSFPAPAFCGLSRFPQPTRKEDAVVLYTHLALLLLFFIAFLQPRGARQRDEHVDRPACIFCCLFFFSFVRLLPVACGGGGGLSFFVCVVFFSLPLPLPLPLPRTKTIHLCFGMLARRLRDTPTHMHRHIHTYM